MNSNWSYSPETPNLGQIQRFLEPCDLEIWRKTLKNNRAPPLCCFQLCAWFHCHMWIQTGVRVRKRLSWVLTCDLDLWPLTLTFCMDITFDHGNNSWKFHDDTMMGTWWKRCDRQTDRRTDGRTENTICRAAWSQLKTIGHLFYVASSFVHHFTATSESKLELQSGNAQFGSNSTIFFSRVTLKFNGWPSKTIGHLFYAISSFVHHFIDIGEFKLELQSWNAQFGSNSKSFRAVWPWNLTDDFQK